MFTCLLSSETAKQAFTCMDEGCGPKVLRTAAGVPAPQKAMAWDCMNCMNPLVWPSKKSHSPPCAVAAHCSLEHGDMDRCSKPRLSSKKMHKNWRLSELHWTMDVVD